MCAWLYKTVVRLRATTGGGKTGAAPEHVVGQDVGNPVKVPPSARPRHTATEVLTRGSPNKSSAFQRGIAK
jgi:hypothetical protein